jgi:hypothetical protein
MAVDRERALDEALRSGKAPEDPELAALAQSARMIEGHLAAQPEHPARERALFIQGVAARRRPFPLFRILLPVSAVAAALVFLGLLGSSSLPGDNLYRVREALAAVGVAKEPTAEAQDLMTSAAARVARAETLVDTEPLRARRLAVDALVDLGTAARIARSEGAQGQLERIEDLEDGAIDVVEDAAKARADRSGGGGPEDRGSGGDENSGPDGDGSGDNSGPGGGDSGGDSSGPGGGDSGDEDSSGPGGGSGSDNSGPGSGSSG